MTPLPSGKHGVGCGREGVLPPTGRAPRHGVRLSRPGPPTEGCAVWDSEPPLRGDVCFGRASSGPRGNSRPSEGVTEWPAQGGPPPCPARLAGPCWGWEGGLGERERPGSESGRAGPAPVTRGLHLSLMRAWLVRPAPCARLFLRELETDACRTGRRGFCAMGRPPLPSPLLP